MSDSEYSKAVEMIKARLEPAIEKLVLAFNEHAQAHGFQVGVQCDYILDSFEKKVPDEKKHR